jgi:hypothetical protein
VVEGAGVVVGVEVGAGRTVVVVVATCFGAFVVEGAGTLPVADALDGGFVVDGADEVVEVDGFAEVEGDVEVLVGEVTVDATCPVVVEARGVELSESRLSDDAHPVSTTAAMSAIPAIAVFLFMIDPLVVSKLVGVSLRGRSTHRAE